MLKSQITPQRRSYIRKWICVKVNVVWRRFCVLVVEISNGFNAEKFVLKLQKSLWTFLPFFGKFSPIWAWV